MSFSTIPELVAESEELLRLRDMGRQVDSEMRKDAERYRWFRDHSLQIVHTSTISWAFHLDKLIDDAMSKVLQP